MTEDRIVTVDRLGAQGDGVVDEPGGEVFVPFALPGERWRIGGGHQPELVEAAPDRRTPPCAHFGLCGGCTAQHMPDATYRAWKRAIVVDAMRHRGLDVEIGELVVVPPASRRRAVFTAFAEDGVTRLGYHGRRSHDLFALAECPVLEPRMVALMPALADLVAMLAGRPDGIRVSVTLTDTGADVAIDAPPGAVRSGQRALAGVADIAARARIARISVAGAPILERQSPRLTCGGATVVPPPGAFVQAVAGAEAAMADLVVRALAKCRTVGDLFCGIGTFSLPLARKARVTALDADRPSLAALEAAARHNQGLKPITARFRDLFRDPLSPAELDALDGVVLDPPRAGAAAQAAQLARSRIKHVAMVSCNPATLARDLRVLVDGGFRVVQVTPIDQFLFAPHVEIVAALRR